MRNPETPDELTDFLVDRVYLSPQQAKEENERRWNNIDLRKKVEAYLDGDLPQIFYEKPKVILARSIITPNKAFFEFQRLAQEIGLEGWCLEFTTDKFCAKNPDKYYLGKLYFDAGIGRKGGIKRSAIKLVDFDRNEGKQIRTVTTMEGESLVEFHHRLMALAAPSANLSSDASDWVLRHGVKAHSFYPKYLALFLCHGILVENFLLKEKNLTQDLFLPAVKVIEEEFGLLPIIVPLIPIEKEDEYTDWLNYPEEIKQYVTNSLRGG